MSVIQGLAVHAAGAELLPFRYDPGDLRFDEVEIGVSHCGVCRSDAHLIANDWGVSHYPFIPGHEVIGAVTAVGEHVRSVVVGQRVGLGWHSNSCGHCESCVKGMENLCASAETTCIRRNGGYANRVRANARFVVPIPDALPSEQGAPLLCGGLGVYNPMRTHGVNPTSRVGVIGIGGLGHLAIQFARVFGAHVTAFSTSPAKEEEAREFGAHHFVNSRETMAMKDVTGSLDLILSTANADEEWSGYLQTLRPAGTLCLVGIPPSPIVVQAMPLISAMHSVTGNPTGSPARMREMLDVAARHGVKAKTERFAMADANEAIKKVLKNKVRYRAVLAN